MSTSKATLLYLRALASLFDEQRASESVLAERQTTDNGCSYHEGKSKAFEEVKTRIESDLKFLDAWTAEDLTR